MLRRLFLIPTVLAAFGFEAPVDTAGPLTVRIQGPTEIVEAGNPVAYTLSFQNAAPVPISGQVRLESTDGWMVQPAALGFDVPAHSGARLRFRVVPAPGSFNAHYPVHAFAEFEFEGRRLTAHPILVLETHFTAPPRAVPISNSSLRVIPALHSGRHRRTGAPLFQNKNATRRMKGWRLGIY